MKFIQFSEYNDWEGEKWNFWLQNDGNQDEILKLDKLLNESSYKDYKIHSGLISEEEVDTLVKNSSSGYFNYHNKVIGIFICPEFLTDETLYKGGIRKLFRK